MTKKKLEYMSSNEWLGDMTTHFMKSGEALRSPENKDQESLARYIPRVANGVKVEYDIAYNMPDKIHGYKFSDFLTKALYIAPQSIDFGRQIITSTCSKSATVEGKRVVDMLRDTINDKYILMNDESFTVEDLVVLPGTNLLVKPDIVDMEKVDDLVTKGAYVKLHPITERTWKNFLKNRWGDKVIDSEVPLYPLMRNAGRIWFTMSSESGIAATLLGKKIGCINCANKAQPSNFEHIYRGIDASRNGSILNKLTVLLSHPESGILTTYHDDPQGRVDAFFEYTSQFPHK